MSEPEWMSRAACRGHWDEGGWDDLTSREQLDVCSTCHVLDQCRADVDDLTRRGCRPYGVVQAGHAFQLHLGSSIRVLSAAAAAPKRLAPRPDPPFDETRTVCAHGHPWTRQTVRLEKSSHGHRRSWRCMECRRASARAQKAGHTLDQQLAIDALETA